MNSIDQRKSPNPLMKDREPMQGGSLTTLTQFALGGLLLGILAFPNHATASDIDGYLEESTTLVVPIDLDRLDFPTTVELMREELSDFISRQVLVELEILGGRVIQSLKEAGVQELYATVSSVDYLSGQVAMIVPTDTPQPVEEALRGTIAMLRQDFGYEVHVSDSAVVVTTEPVWERISKLPAADRENLIETIDQPNDSVLSISFSIREELRSEVAEIWPDRLPKQVGIDLSPRQIMRDVIAWRFDLQTPPELHAQLTAICEDDAGAERISDLINHLAEKFNIEGMSMARSDHQATVTAGGADLTGLLSSLGSQARMHVSLIQQSNNLKQLALAIHNFYDTYQHLPPRMTVDEAGQPLLSWRVFLLPYIDERQLYDEFRLDEPWDSPHNRQLIDRMPAVFRSEQYPELEAGHTLVQVPLMEGSAWHGERRKPLKLSDIRDGVSNTILFVTALPDKSVVWTRPNDLELNEDALIEEQLFGEREYLYSAFFDGSVQVLARDQWEGQLRAMLTHAGGDVIRQ